MSLDRSLNKILIIDFGSQFTQLIARRIRELGIFSEIVSHKKIKSKDVNKFTKGIILSGGPLNVYEIKKYSFDKNIILKGLPVLGICFGHQAIAQALGGHVTKSSKGWGIGIKEITTKKYSSLLGNFNKLNLIFFHQDQVVKLPKEAELLASNSFCDVASFSIGDSVLTLQAHPEFNHDFSLRLLKARKSNIEPLTYVEAVNELKTLDHDGELITPNIIKFLEQKCEY